MKKKRKSYIIFGCGKFGASVAEELMEEDNMVLVVDKNEEKITAIADKVTKAVIADTSDIKLIESLGLSDFDVAVVATTGDLSSSVMCTMLCKEAGIPYVVVKVQDEMQQKVFEKLGADRVIIPEYDAAAKLVHLLNTRNFIDVFELSENIVIAELPIPKSWIGQTLKTLGVRKKYQINVLAVRLEGSLQINWDADQKLPEDCNVVLLGENSTLEKLQNA